MSVDKCAILWLNHFTLSDMGAFQNIMKPRSKRILSALFWAAIIATLIINGLREQSLWIGGAL